MTTITFKGKTYTVQAAGRTFELYGPSGALMYSVQPYVGRNPGRFFSMKVNGAGLPSGSYGSDMVVSGGILSLA